MKNFSFCLMMTLSTSITFAQTGTFNIQTATWSIGNAATHNCTWNDPVLTVNSGADIIITGTVSNGRRMVITSYASVTLENLSITVNNANEAALQHNGSTLYLTLLGENFLQSGSGCAGIQIPYVMSSLYFNEESTGNLTTKGGNNASGISNCFIHIFGGTINATGGNNGAGIEGGGTIAIIAGTVNANGGSGGAGIGGSYKNSGGRIIIKGGTINATGGSNGAGIGGGDLGESGTIVISDGNITATGGDKGAGIGGGNGTITINGGTIYAKGENGGAGIGGNRGGSGDTIIIYNGVITATGSNGAAGIGTGISPFAGGGVIAIHGGTLPKVVIKAPASAVEKQGVLFTAAHTVLFVQLIFSAVQSTPQAVLARRTSAEVVLVHIGMSSLMAASSPPWVLMVFGAFAMAIWVPVGIR